MAQKKDASQAYKFLSTLSPDDQRRLQDKMTSGDLVVSKSIYLDISVLRDVRLGAALSLVLDETALSDDAKNELLVHIRQNISSYSNRHYQDIPHYFPKLPYTNSDIDNCLSNNQNTNRIFFTAPVTRFLRDTLPIHLAINDNHSQLINDKRRPTLYINLYPLNVTDRIVKTTCSFFEDELNVRVKMLSRKLSEFTIDQLLQFDEFYIYDVLQLLSREDVVNAFSDLKFMKARFFVADHFGYNYKPHKLLHKERDFVEATFAVLSDRFKYIPSVLLAPLMMEPETHD